MPMISIYLLLDCFRVLAALKKRVYKACGMVAGRPARGLQGVQNTCRLPENSMQTVQNTFLRTRNQFASRAKSFLVDQIPFCKPCKAHLVDQIPFCKPCKILFGGPDSISQAVQTPFGGPDSILQALQTPCGSTRHHFARFLNLRASAPPCSKMLITAHALLLFFVFFDFQLSICPVSFGRKRDYPYFCII